jgi:hypothetical protein
MRSLLGAEPLRLAELPKPAFRGGCGVVQLVCLTEDQLTDKKEGGVPFQYFISADEGASPSLRGCTFNFNI